LELFNMDEITVIRSKKIRPVFKQSSRTRQELGTRNGEIIKTSASPVRKPFRVSRRDFFKLLLTSVGGLVMAEVGLVGYRFFRSGSQAGRMGGRVTAGPLTNFPPGTITEFSNEGFFLIHTKEGDLKALYRRCPHLGCTVDWVAEKEHFYCPCHGSSFDKAGKFDGPPVPRNLDKFAVNIDNNMVIVDTSRPFSDNDDGLVISAQSRN
jgi:cytochrome b6-f complex iron-sulfur subunit